MRGVAACRHGEPALKPVAKPRQLPHLSEDAKLSDECREATLKVHISRKGELLPQGTARIEILFEFIHPPRPGSKWFETAFLRNEEISNAAPGDGVESLPKAKEIRVPAIRDALQGLPAKCC